MGLCFSSKLSNSSTSFKNIRVVHLNGYVEEFDHPVTVSEVTGKPTKHFVFTHAQLLSAGTQHLKPETVLDPGTVYFILPYSAFQSHVSPRDLAPIARKLSAIAKTSHSSCKAKSGRKTPPKWRSADSRPNRFSNRYVVVESETNMQRTQKSGSWKPILSTIRELSFNRRSESDIQEKDLEK